MRKENKEEEEEEKEEGKRGEEGGRGEREGRRGERRRRKDRVELKQTHPPTHLPLLPSSVPQLKDDSLIVDLECLGGEVQPEGITRTSDKMTFAQLQDQ